MQNLSFLGMYAVWYELKSQIHAICISGGCQNLILFLKQKSENKKTASNGKHGIVIFLNFSIYRINGKKS